MNFSNLLFRFFGRFLFLAPVLVSGLAVGGWPQTGNAAERTAEAVFLAHCASCHGAVRYGGFAPPLIPQALKRKSPEQLEQIIRDGLPQTQMQPFGKILSASEIRSVAGLLKAPVGKITWSDDQIRASRQEPPPRQKNWQPPTHRESLILVVERGTSSVSVLDGRSMKELDRYQVGRVHGGLKFDHDFLYAFAATRDGTVARYDLMSGEVRAMVKVAVNTRNMALSPDSRWVAAVNQLPRTLVVLDGDLRHRKTIGLKGEPSGVYDLPGENAFVLGLRDQPHLIMVPYPDLSPRTVSLPLPFEDFVFVPGTTRILASARKGKSILLYDWKSGKILNRLQTTGLPHLFSAAFFLRDNQPHAALNHIGIPRLTILNLSTFRVVKTLTLNGAGYFARTHPGTEHIWVDTNTEAIRLVRKSDLTLLEKPLIPEAGKKALHVEFTADGGQALVSVWDQVGAVVVYDTRTLRETHRLPYTMPVGKYNTRNKTFYPIEKAKP